jgi:hypothetical protein
VTIYLKKGKDFWDTLSISHFVTLKETLSSSVSPLPSSLFTPELKWVKRISYPIDCNWKVFVDNYLDGGYHVQYLHKDLTAAIDIGDLISSAVLAIWQEALRVPF